VKIFGISVWTIGVAAALAAYSQTQVRDQGKLSIDRPETLELHRVNADFVSYRGRKAVRITDATQNAGDDARRIAMVKGTSVQDGSVEVNLSGDTAPDAAANLRGFVGVAFRVNGDGSRYECIYLRPKNGRSEDQLQRNHSTQYISVPGFPWQELRAATPGKYESYVDLVPGDWTRVKIQFAGTNARLYVNGSEQPVLVVHDLKQPVEAGAIALWIGPGTTAYFSDLSLSR
jgi:hypothetical protein